MGIEDNCVVRMIDRKANIIYTIAGNPKIIQGKRNNPDETDLFKTNLPKICSFEYFNQRLYIPEWDGDSIVL